MATIKHVGRDGAIAMAIAAAIAAMMVLAVLLAQLAATAFVQVGKLLLNA